MLRYLLFKFAYRLVLVLPKKWSYWIGCRVADIDYIFKKRLRQAVKSNLRQIFSVTNPDGVKRSIISRHARAVFRNFSKYLVDFFSFSKLNKENIHEIVKVKRIEHIRDALRKGKGVVALTAHLGNWELGGVVTALLGFSVNVVTLSHENTGINRLFVNQRAIKGVRAIPVGSGAGEYINVLRKNQIIGLVGDRLTSDAGIEVKFFNKQVLVPRGPAVLSLRTGAPIVPSFMIRTQKDKFDFIYEQPIDPADFKGVMEITQRIVSVLEKYIGEYPSQWFLFYKVWG